MREYVLSDFDYHLPEELIAQRPAKERTASRLLVLDRASGTIRHKSFGEIVDFAEAGDLFVANDARVIRGKFFGHRKTGARVEFLMLEEFADAPFRALLGNAARLRPGEEIGGCLDGTAVVRLVEKLAGGEWLVAPGENFTRTRIASDARLPLPPYVRRTGDAPPDVHAEDAVRYQTVYANRPVAAAAPTAGLHFDRALIDRIVQKGARFEFVTLAVGVGTFRPVKSEKIDEHRMHSEEYFIGAETAAAISARRGRLITVGTTVVRTLESWRRTGQTSGATEIFIRPPDKLASIDALITNFHLPRSTLLMLVASFAGLENVLRAYAEAVKLRYRFFSYGDAMLIT